MSNRIAGFGLCILEFFFLFFTLNFFSPSLHTPMVEMADSTAHLKSFCAQRISHVLKPDDSGHALYPSFHFSLFILILINSHVHYLTATFTPQ